VVDTGPLVAAALVDDPDHASCVAWFEQATGSPVVPDLVIPEVCYLLASGARTHVEVAFLRSLISRHLAIEHLEESDIQLMTELVDTYADLPLGAVAASVIAVAERLGTIEVVTLDHRHRQHQATRCDAHGCRGRRPSLTIHFLGHVADSPRRRQCWSRGTPNRWSIS
jgi:predicted nucleic acid-binding protein